MILEYQSLQRFKKSVEIARKKIERNIWNNDEVNSYLCSSYFNISSNHTNSDNARILCVDPEDPISNCTYRNPDCRTLRSRYAPDLHYSTIWVYRKKQSGFDV